jgi:hypothetical protein
MISQAVVELWPIVRLVPYIRNPRKNDAVDRMIASIQKFGFKITVLARSNGEIVDGLRLKAARKMELAEVPVMSAARLARRKVSMEVESRLMLYPAFSGRLFRILYERQIGGLNRNRFERLPRQKLLLVFHAFFPGGEAHGE